MRKDEQQRRLSEEEEECSASIEEITLGEPVSKRKMKEQDRPTITDKNRAKCSMLYFYKMLIHK